MARSERHIPAPPERVWEVLADGRRYGDWVVGVGDVRPEPAFPKRGTRLREKVGWGLLAVPARTEVIDVEAPRRLVLRAATLGLGGARITLELAERGGGTHLTMVEDPADRLSALAWTPLVHLGVRVRNAEALRRLEGLVVDA